MEKEETYIDFGIAPYAIVSILLMLDNAGIKNYFITQEDRDLHIRIPKSELEELDHRTKCPQDFKGEEQCPF